MKKARKVSAVFLGLAGGLLALIGMSLGGPVRTVAADETVAANETVAQEPSITGSTSKWCAQLVP